MESRAPELRAIAKELIYITKRMKSSDEDDLVTSDWKFAASVIDRTCLIFFAFTTGLASAIVIKVANEH